MADTLVEERPKKDLFIPTEIILRCLEFVPTPDLCRLLEEETTSFRDVPASLLRSRFLRMIEEPGVSLSFECGLPASYNTTTHQDLRFSHIDDSSKNLAAYFSFSHGGPPFTFSLDSNEVFQTVLFNISLKSVIPSPTRISYAVTIVDGMHRFFKSSFSPISRLEKHSLADYPTPPCALHALHLPPQITERARPHYGHSSSFGSSSSSYLSSSYPSYFSNSDQVTKYSIQYTSVEVSIPQLLLISERNQANGGCTVFIFGR